METRTALLIVDVQNDFCPGGTLAVPEGDKIIAPLNLLIEKCRESKMPVFATRDWHPPDHCSFVERGGAWPVHCVRETRGAGFHPGLKIDPSLDSIISKAGDREKDAYSGFDRTGLARLLREKSVKTLWVGGLATDYCVKATVLDAMKEGFDVFVVTDCVKGVDVNPGDSQRALEEMERAGAKLKTF